jgi:hypothetical protein
MTEAAGSSSGRVFAAQFNLESLDEELAGQRVATSAAYGEASEGRGDRRLLAKAFTPQKTLSAALARVQERWSDDPAQWLTFGMTLAMSQRILAEVGRPLGPAEREPA